MACPAAGPASAAARRASVVSRLRTGRLSIPPALLGLGSLALLLRLPNLTESLWFDELASTRVRLPDAAGLFRQILEELLPPLYWVFMFGWIGLFGDSELAIRLPPLLFGLASIGLTYALARRFIPRRAALLAAFLASVSPVHIWYSQEARPYAAALCLLLLAVLSYHELRESPTSGGWLAVYAVAMWSAVLTHYYLTVYLLIISILCLREPELRVKILLANAVVLISLVAFFLVKGGFVRISTEAPYLRPFTLLELWMLLFNWLLLGNSLWTVSPFSHPRAVAEHPLMVLCQVAFLFLFIRGIVCIWKESPRAKELLAYLFLLPAGLLALDWVGFSKTYIERSLLVLLPFFSMVMARGVTRFRLPSLSAAFTTALIGVSVVACAAFFSKPDAWTVYKQNADWRSAARYLEGGRTAGETSLVIAATWATELLYYGNGFVEGGGPVDPGGPRSGGERIGGRTEIRYVDRESGLCGIVAAQGVDAFSMIKNRYWLGQVNRHLEEVGRDGRCQLVETQAFKGLEIYRFRVRTGGA